MAVAALPGCRRTEAEYQKLAAENEYLRGEVERLNKRDFTEKGDPKAASPNGDGPDLTLTVVDLFSQRFDDNEFRAKQRLANKVIRLSGGVDAVSADGIGIAGVSKRFGNVRIGVNLTSGYAMRIRDGLAALERGTIVTVQGKFLYDRMTLSDALFVDASTGRALYSDDLLALAAGTPIARPATTPKPAPTATPAPK
jgi:hypothetical protein